MGRSDCSFSAERRLSKQKQVQAVFDRGEFFEGQYCHLIRGDWDGDLPTRAAFVVSQKTASRATERNRIKRLMRESFRLRIPDLQEGWPLVFLATREAHGDLKRQDFDADLGTLLEQAGLLKPGIDSTCSNDSC